MLHFKNLCLHIIDKCKGIFKPYSLLHTAVQWITLAWNTQKKVFKRTMSSIPQVFGYQYWTSGGVSANLQVVKILPALLLSPATSKIEWGPR